MTPRFICPHCHNPIDPSALDVADSANADYRICPECDELIVLSVTRKEPGEESPPQSIALLSVAHPIENLVQ